VQVATVRGARADLDRLLAFKAYATVRAPFAGVVTQRTTDIGDLVGPGATTQQPMFTVADTSRIRLYVGVPQAYAAAMKAGLDATLTVPDHPGETFAARVVGTSDAINPVNGALQVQLLADNKAHALRAGGYAQVSFKVPAQAGAVSIPASALLFRSSGTEVATVGPDNKVRMVPIQIGRDLGKTVEVVSGLTPGPGSSTIPRFHRARSGRACRRGASWLRHGGARSPEQRAFSPWPRDWRGVRSPPLRAAQGGPCAQIRRHGAVGSG
jgi:RND family efflux transporter MFP subunit